MLARVRRTSPSNLIEAAVRTLRALPEDVQATAARVILAYSDFETERE